MFVYLHDKLLSLNAPLASWLARCVRPLQQLHWLPLLSVSAGGGPWPGVYCQECVVALKLIYRTDCVALPQGIILFFWGGDALTGLSPGSLTQLLRALIDPVIMRVFTWADRKIVSVAFLGGRRLFHVKHDLNARLSKDEQKRNGDKNPHEDKSWPVHSQLRVGRQRTWQVSFPAFHWWKTNLCADFVRVLAEWNSILMILCKCGNHIRSALCTCKWEAC